MGEEEKQTREPLFAGIKQLVHEVFFDANIAREQISDEHLRKFWFFVEQTHHHHLLQTHNGRSLQGIGGGNPQGLSRQASLAKEIAFLQDCDYRFFTPFGYHCDLNFPILDVEDCVCRISLREYRLLVPIVLDGFSAVELS